MLNPIQYLSDKVLDKLDAVLDTAIPDYAVMNEGEFRRTYAEQVAWHEKRVRTLQESFDDARAKGDIVAATCIEQSLRRERHVVRELKGRPLFRWVYEHVNVLVAAGLIVPWALLAIWIGCILL